MKLQYNHIKYKDLDTKIPTEYATSWKHLMECLYGNTWQEDIRCHRSNLIFRGLSDSRFQLLTKLQRIAGDSENGPEHCSVVEKPLIRNFKRYTESLLTDEPSDSIWRWLSVMQYYGAPTRLIDWTSSPFVALHFAVCDEEFIEQDGIVWCINPNELSIVDVPLDFTAGEGVRYQLYTADQLDAKINKATERRDVERSRMGLDTSNAKKKDITSILDDLDSFCAADHPFVVFLDPPAHKRITNQATIYSIMASSTAIFSDWLERSPHGCKKVIIPAKLKREVIDKLSQANITERVIEPGLNGLAKWLTKYYTPRNPIVTLKTSSNVLDCVKTYTPSTWEDVLDVLFNDDLTWDENLHMHRSKFVFRGLPDKNFSLVTSLQRMSKGDGKHSRNIENHIIRNFQRYAYGETSISSNSNLYNWLALMQHQGAATRLLDWSQSPMVSLFFATIYSKFDDKDGVIICLNPTTCSKFIPQDVSGTQDSYNVFTTDQLEYRIRHSDAFMLNALKQTNVHVASVRSTTISDLEALSKEPFLIFLEPPSIDERIVNQSSLFSVLSKPDYLLDDWIVNHPDCCRRIIIPKQLKAEIRDKLDQTNINERVLFPGLSGTAQFLTRYYTFRPKKS